MSKKLKKVFVSLAIMLMFVFAIGLYFNSDNVIEASAATTCKVTFSPGNGTQPWTTTKTVGTAYGTLPTVSRPGYTFLGWYTAQTGGTKISSSTRVTDSSSIILHGRWQQNYCSVTYNANLGIGAPPKQTGISYGSLCTLSSAKPTFTGYTFLGWSTNYNAKTAQYRPGESIKLYSDITLYAIWSRNTYTLKYNVNGGGYSNNPPSSLTKYYGDSFTVTSICPTRTGYTFLGWSTSSTATKATYKSGNTINATKNMTLYAVWKKNTYTLKYNANGGGYANNPPSSLTKYYGESFVVTSTSPKRTGYTFLGWSTSSTATTASYKSGNTINATKNMTLYAVWKKNTYTLKYNANGGGYANNPPSSLTKYYGESFVVTSTSPKRTGYTFLGWSTSSTATRATYKSGNTIIATKNMTLYAVWQIKKFNVCYDVKGGTGGPVTTPINIEYGTTYTIPATVPTKPGHTFHGWSTSSAATAVNYKPGDTITVKSKVYLYAVWKKNTYTLKYNVNGGGYKNNPPANQTKYYNDKFVVTSIIPEKTGYSFVGWSTNSKATVSSYLSGAKITANKNITLYAVWVKTYTITYDLRGGTGHPTKDIKIHDVPIKISSISPKKEGYVFLGWSPNKNATTSSYLKGATYTSNSNITLYAVWQPCHYVYFNTDGGNSIKRKEILDIENQSETIGSLETPTHPSKCVKFEYWYIPWKFKDDNGGYVTIDYKVNPDDEITSNVTLYAKWSDSHSYDKKNIVAETSANSEYKKIVIKCDNCDMAKELSISEFAKHKGYYKDYELDISRAIYEYAESVCGDKASAEKMRELYESYNCSDVNIENLIEAMKISDEYVKKVNAVLDFFEAKKTQRDENIQNVTKAVSGIMDKTADIVDKTGLSDSTIFTVASDVASLFGNIDNINHGSDVDKINGTIDMFTTVLSYFDVCGINVGDLYYGTILKMVKEDINNVLVTVNEHYGNIGVNYFASNDRYFELHKKDINKFLEYLHNEYLKIVNSKSDTTGMNLDALEAYAMHILNENGKDVQNQINSLLAN